MAESILTKVRVKKIEFADPLKAESELATASWKEQPLTLRDDAVEIVEESPEESEVFSHENDAAEDLLVSGKSLSITGSFIKADRATLVALLGGAKKGTAEDPKLERSATKQSLNKAIRFTLSGGGTIVVPNAKGFVTLHMGLGYDSVVKYPFKFKALKASASWDCDIII